MDYFVADNGNWATLSKTGYWKVQAQKVTVKNNCTCQSWVVKGGRSLSGLQRLIGGAK